jgi:hypothetical protein
VKKEAIVKQEDKEEPREPPLPSLPSLPSTPTLTILLKRPHTISSDTTTPPLPPKQPISKKPIRQADSLVRPRKQKEEEGEPLLKGIDKSGRRRRGSRPPAKSREVAIATLGRIFEPLYTPISCVRKSVVCLLHPYQQIGDAVEQLFR